jgi:hypothetical protein
MNQSMVVASDWNKKRARLYNAILAMARLNPSEAQYHFNRNLMLFDNAQYNKLFYALDIDFSDMSKADAIEVYEARYNKYVEGERD